MLNMLNIQNMHNNTKYALQYKTVCSQLTIDGKELKLNKDKIIKLNKEFHGIVDDNEPEYIEDNFDGMVINPFHIMHLISIELVS